MVINNISVHAGLYVFAVCMWCVFMFLCFYFFGTPLYTWENSHDKFLFVL